MKFFISLIALITLNLTMAQKSYLALGDSYTIGEGLEIDQSWPHQLVQLLNQKGFDFKPPQIIAKTGWRTDELKRAMRKELKKETTFDLVSLLIGVNNQYQEKSFKKYKREFKKLLKKAIERSKHAHKGVFVVSIPDYGVTPFAVEKDKKNAILDLMEYNSYAKTLCNSLKVPFYDITSLSAKYSRSEDMLMDDKLHPNAEQYKNWINAFLPQVIEQLKSM